MHRVFAPLACRVILARGPRAAFKDSAQLSGTAPRRLRDSVTLTHPCQHAAAHLPCTRPPDALYACRPARPGARDRAGARAFVTTRAGTHTTARRGEEEDEIVAGTSFGAAGGTNTLGRASMRPQMLATPSAPDDPQAALSQKTSYGTKLFEVAIPHLCQRLQARQRCRRPSDPSGDPLRGTGPGIHMADFPLRRGLALLASYGTNP